MDRTAPFDYPIADVLAARWSPRAFTDDPVTRRELQSLLEAAHYNQVWAKDAPLLMISVAQHRNAKRELRRAEHDVGLAVGTMLVEATTLGLHVHQMAGYDEQAAARVLEIPEPCAPVAAIAAGRLGAPGTLPEKLAARESAERKRNPQAEFAFSGRFGSAK